MAASVTRASLRVLGLGILIALVTPTLPGCVHHHHRHSASAPAKVKKGGPPPWAPAHGYRHKHAQGVDLAFDSALGVYVVVGYENHFFYRDHFYRGSGSDWQMSAHIRGSWISVDASRLPHGLAVRAHEKHRHHPKPHPAKQGKGRGHRW
jgi:hypothetical protein